jgi:hypothetical protein
MAAFNAAGHIGECLIVNMGGEPEVSDLCSRVSLSAQ